MLSVNVALFLFVTVLAFTTAWRLMPAGWLTAATGITGAIMIAFHEALGEMMPELRSLMPAEYRPWLVVVVLLLTVIARFRNKAAEQ
jgi:hypothetical protein